MYYEKKDLLVLMLLFLCFFVTPYILLLCNQNGNKGYDTQEEMMSKCSNLIGFNDFTLNKTTISDIYTKYSVDNYEQGFEKIKKGYYNFSPNIDQKHYNDIKDSIDWTIIQLDNILINHRKEEVSLHFYQDTLIEISYRYPNYTQDGKKIKELPEYFVNNYGYGLHTDYGSDYEYFWEIFNKSSTYYNEGRKYINGDIHMLICNDCWDVIIFHKPKLLELFSKIKGITEKESTTTSDYGASQRRGYNSMESYDDEYWESIQRENALKAMGMKDAAKIERQKRLEYVQGGGYTSPNGGSQVHYQGSKEQQEDLKRIEQMGW